MRFEITSLFKDLRSAKEVAVFDEIRDEYIKYKNALKIVFSPRAGAEKHAYLTLHVLGDTIIDYLIAITVMASNKPGVGYLLTRKGKDVKIIGSWLSRRGLREMASLIERKEALLNTELWIEWARHTDKNYIRVLKSFPVLVPLLSNTRILAEKGETTLLYEIIKGAALLAEAMGPWLIVIPS